MGEIEGEPVLDVGGNTDYKWLTHEELKAKADLDVYAKEDVEQWLID